jgi:hypothetical protein
MSFCNGCINLKSITYHNQQKITVLNELFMMNCSSLSEIDLSPLTNLNHIKEHFMHGCTKLTTILPKSLTIIDDNFMRECTSLTSITCTNKQKELLLLNNQHLKNLTKLTFNII